MLGIKVKINKCKKSTYWYNDLIGKEIEVCYEPMEIDGIEQYVCCDLSRIRYILKEDCNISDSTFIYNHFDYVI